MVAIAMKALSLILQSYIKIIRTMLQMITLCEHGQYVTENSYSYIEMKLALGLRELSVIMLVTKQ